MSNVKIRLQSIRRLVQAELVILNTVILFHAVFSQQSSGPNPTSPPPPSNMDMAKYSKAAVVCNSEVCAKIGVDIIANGGNAIEAVIATMLCDGVSTPEYMGLGGGFMMTYYDAATKKVKSINARETAPGAAKSDMFSNNPNSSLVGGLAIAVPGELRGYWSAYQKFKGTTSWDSLVQPTIKLCQEGLKINDRLAINLKNQEELIKNDKLLKQTFFDEKTGTVKKAGDTYTLPELANTLCVVANEGADAIYNGSLTANLLKDLSEAGSNISAKDLVDYQVIIEDSFSVKLKNGYVVYSAPPPGSGLVLAYILRILDGLLPTPDAGIDAQRVVETFKFAFGLRSLLGDPNFRNISKAYNHVQSDQLVEEVRGKISDNSTSNDPQFYGADFGSLDDAGTNNIVVIDTAGNVVVVTSTINTQFGSGFMSPSTGIIFNNEMADFSIPKQTNSNGLPPLRNNFIKPGKRPLSSMSPTIFTDGDGNFLFGVGAAGGTKIIPATAYVSMLKLWYNFTIKESVDKPRFFHQLIPMEVEYECGVLDSVLQTLTNVGHTIKQLDCSSVSSVVTAIDIGSGTIEAMADFRRPGTSSGL